MPIAHDDDRRHDEEIEITHKRSYLNPDTQTWNEIDTFMLTPNWFACLEKKRFNERTMILFLGAVKKEIIEKKASLKEFNGPVHGVPSSHSLF